MKEDALRKQLAAGINSQAAKSGARWALERADVSADPRELADIVRALAECILSKRPKGAPRKVKLEDGAALPDDEARNKVNVRTYEHVALSMYAYLVSARDIVDGRPPTYPGYSDDTKQEAIERLKDFCLHGSPRQGIKSNARDAVIERIKETTQHCIKIDRFEVLKKLLK